jgi:hypothetical protein
MFRFVLQVAFIRRVLQLGIVKVALVLVFTGALIAGLIYTYVVFQAVVQRSHTPHVHPSSAH